MDGVAIFIKEIYEKNEIGERISKESKREVFVQVYSIGRTDWQQAGQLGLSPSIMIKINRINYEGEKIVEVDRMRYGIYRTYCPPDSDDMELYLEEKAGV